MYSTCSPSLTFFVLSALALLNECPLVAQAQEKRLDVQAFAEAATKWESVIQDFEAQDKTKSAGPEEILVLGSSSIRLWDSIDQELAPWKVLRRGYGGARFSDLSYFLPRLIKSHSPKAVLIYVGNDITGKPETDRTPDEVVAMFRYITETIHSHRPKTPIFLIGITPAPSRFHAWPAIEQANKQLEEFCREHDNLHFIRTASEYLVDGKPRPELFVADQLHQNAKGYQLWSTIIRAELDRVLKSTAKTEASTK